MISVSVLALAFKNDISHLRILFDEKRCNELMTTHFRYHFGFLPPYYYEQIMTDREKHIQSQRGLHLKKYADEQKNE